MRIDAGYRSNTLIKSPQIWQANIYIRTNLYIDVSLAIDLSVRIQYLIYRLRAVDEPILFGSLWVKSNILLHEIKWASRRFGLSDGWRDLKMGRYHEETLASWSRSSCARNRWIHQLKTFRSRRKLEKKKLIPSRSSRDPRWIEYLNHNADRRNEKSSSWTKCKAIPR